MYRSLHIANKRAFQGVLLLILAFAPELVSAQVFYLGFDAGAGADVVRYMRKEYREQFKSKIRPGAEAGITMNVPLTSSFFLSSDLNYALRGRKIRPVENDWTMSEIHHFLVLPVILNIQREGSIQQIGPFEKLGPFTWFIGAGPNISYMLGGSGVLKTYALTTPYKISFGGKESDFHYLSFRNANRWQWGMDIQAGLISPLASGDQLITKIRFTYGHTHLGAPDGSNMPVLGFIDNIAHNYKILNISVAYLFDLDVSLLRKGKSSNGQKIKTKSINSPTPKGKNINKIKKNKH